MVSYASSWTSQTTTRNCSELSYILHCRIWIYTAYILFIYGIIFIELSRKKGTQKGNLVKWVLKSVALSNSDKWGVKQAVTGNSVRFYPFLVTSVTLYNHSTWINRALIPELILNTGRDSFHICWINISLQKTIQVSLGVRGYYRNRQRIRTSALIYRKPVENTFWPIRIESSTSLLTEHYSQR